MIFHPFCQISFSFLGAAGSFSAHKGAETLPCLERCVRKVEGIFKSSQVVSPRIWCVATLVRHRSSWFLLPFWVETDLMTWAFILTIWWYVTHVNSSVNPQGNTIRKKYVDAENAQMILHFYGCSIQLVAPWLQPRCLKIRKLQPPAPASWPVSAPSTCIGPSILLRIMLTHSPDCTYAPRFLKIAKGCDWFCVASPPRSKALLQRGSECVTQDYTVDCESESSLSPFWDVWGCEGARCAAKTRRNLPLPAVSRVGQTTDAFQCNVSWYLAFISSQRCTNFVSGCQRRTSLLPLNSVSFVSLSWTKSRSKLIRRCTCLQKRCLAHVWFSLFNFLAALFKVT